MFCIFIWLKNNLEDKIMEKGKEDFYEKIQRLAEKTEKLIDKQVEKLKESGVVDKISDYADKTEDFVENKIEQFKKSNIPNKVDDFIEKTEKKAGEVIKKVQVVGDKISEKVEDFVDDIKNRSDQKGNKDSDNETNKPKPI